MFKKLCTFSMVFSLLAVTCLGNSAPIKAVTVITYPLQSCFTSTTEYSVTAQGNSVPVVKYMPHGDHQYYWSHLSASGTVNYVIDAKENISSYEVTPKNFGIAASVNGTKLSFTVGGSRYLSITINSKKVLYLLIDPLEVNPPLSSGKGIYNVTASPYNADKSGNNLCSTAIQNAINDASAAGGGTVYIPDGIYLSGPLQVKSNVNLYLKGGAVLLATLDKSKWTVADKRNNFIQSNEASNVKIFGRGTIYCRGNLLNDNRPTNQSTAIRITGIRLYNTNGATIDGIISCESTEWNICPWTQSSNINITNTKVLNEKTWEWNDGIDIVGANHVTVRHCFVTTCDDAACVKSIDYPVYAVAFEDMVVHSTHASGFKFGNQAEDDIYDIVAKDFNVLSCERGFNFDHWYGNGNWHDLHVQNFRVEKMTGNFENYRKAAYIDCAFRFEIENRTRNPNDPNPDFNFESGVAGPISNVEISNVQFDGVGPNNPYFWGEDNTNKINNVTITNLKMGGRLILSIADGPIENKGYADNITFPVKIIK
jgi:hypothetical protein